MLPWDLSAFTTLLSLLQCSLETWLSPAPVPLGLEGLSSVPFELEELSPDTWTGTRDGEGLGYLCQRTLAGYSARALLFLWD